MSTQNEAVWFNRVFKCSWIGIAISIVAATVSPFVMPGSWGLFILAVFFVLQHIAILIYGYKRGLIRSPQEPIEELDRLPIKKKI